MARRFAEIAYSESVKAVQEHYNSRRANQKLEESVVAANDKLSDGESHFISQMDTFFMASVGENGWPYIQHRGGPKGFVKVLDEETLAFPDFRGNLQFISVGNIRADERVSLFFLDFVNKRRLKVWAKATVVDVSDDEQLASLVRLPDYRARIERVIVFKIEAFDWNCPQHIKQRFTEEEVIGLQEQLIEHITRLESELASYRDDSLSPLQNSGGLRIFPNCSPHRLPIS